MGMRRLTLLIHPFLHPEKVYQGVKSVKKAELLLALNKDCVLTDKSSSCFFPSEGRINEGVSKPDIFLEIFFMGQGLWGWYTSP